MTQNRGTTIRALALVALVLFSSLAMAQETRVDKPSGGAMIVDALFARPLLAAATVGGMAVFVVSLPFSALGGNVEETAQVLIKTPAEAAFLRCLGCRTSNRADEF